MNGVVESTIDPQIRRANKKGILGSLQQYPWAIGVQRRVGAWSDLTSHRV